MNNNIVWPLNLHDALHILHTQTHTHAHIYTVFPTDLHYFCGGIYVKMNYLEALIAETEVSPVTLYTKQSSAHKCCFIRHYMQDEMKMVSNIF